jgi:hypothetical protein
MALTLVTSDLINGLDYSKLTGTIPTWNQNTTGSAATLTTARNIGGVSFNGSAAINLPGVNTAGNQNTSGTAAGLSATLAVGSGGTGVTSITALKNVLDDETWTFANKITSDAGIDIDNFNIDGNTISLSSGNMVLGTASAASALTISDYGLLTMTAGSSSNPRLTFAGADVSGAHFIQINRGTSAMEFHVNGGTRATISSGGTVKADAFAPLDSSTSILDFATDNVIKFYTSSTERLTISSGGVSTFTNGTSYQLLQLKTSRTDANYGIELYHSDSTLYGYLGGTGSSVLTGANTGDLVIRGQGDVVFASGGNNRRLTISSGGLATFKSSYVAANQYGGELTVGGSSTDFGIAMKYNQGGATSGTIYCSPGYTNAATTLMLGTGSNTNQLVLKGDGKVGIGITSPSAKLTVSNPSSSTGSAAAGRLADSSIHLIDTTHVGRYSQITFGYPTSNTHASAYIGYVSTSSSASGKGDLVFGTKDDTAYNTQPSERLRISSGGVVSVNNKFSQNSVGRRCNSGYTTGNASFFVDYTVTVMSSLKVTAVFNHYGYIPTYGCARFSLVALGQNITTIDISTTTSGNGGSWSISRINNTTLRITKNAGTYSGAGHWFIEVIGTEVS